MLEENQRQEEDGSFLAKSSSMCMSEISTHLNESRGKQGKDIDSIHLKKLIKNRESATRCRNKRKAAINAMANEVTQITRETEELSIKAHKYNEFLEKVRKDNVILERKLSLATEESKQLQIQLSMVHNKYAQIQQAVFMLCNQDASIKTNGIKLQ